MASRRALNRVDEQNEEATMDDKSQDQKQFFKDFGATAEQTVQEVRGFEES